ncbi:TrmH family RNA methyltransferase [Calidifontibacter indicus]|uniref:TrmH family RNA methyltransferase n=1 Tax=Calidifontibacter indicus TaxID=419650 RepID=UPI003D7136D3
MSSFYATKRSKRTGITELRESGWDVAALALDDDAESLDALAAAKHEKLCLVVGTEGDGLSRRTTALATRTVCIPMAGGVDSLNVAAASAVALWATR